MKKSLLVILSLILTQVSTLAVGVDCWEEYDQTFNPNTKSKMQSVLGNDVTITRVKTGIITAGQFNATIPITNYIRFIDTYSYYLKFWNPSPNNMNYLSVTSPNYRRADTDSILSGKSLDYFTATSQCYTYHGNTSFAHTTMLGSHYCGLQFSMYVHTYCIVSDHSSSGGGGGGGAAGAAVNYIIKAD